MDDINVRVGDEFKIVARDILPDDAKLFTFGFLEEVCFKPMRPQRTIEYTLRATEEGTHTAAIFKGADRHHVQIINSFRSEI